MNGIQTGAAAPGDHGSLDAYVMRPVSPTSQYGGRSVDPLTGQTASIQTADSIVPTSSRKWASSRDTVADQDLPQLADFPDLANPHLAINYPAPDWTPLEKRIKLPLSTPTLEKDEALTSSLQEIGSLSDIEKRLAERSRVERLDGEYKFDLLMPSLRNMRTFISHIREGHQFPEPLTDGEHKVLAWLAGKTQTLLDAQAPYQRTVYLAVALVALCEIITERQILAPLRSSDSQASGRPAGSQIDSSLSSSVDPEIIMKCCWGENNPGGLNTIKTFCKRYVTYSNLAELFTALDNNTLFVFPSFQDLGLKDFCRFGHLPVYPIGMIPTYALNADGYMMSPLQFLMHDITHMSTLVMQTSTYARQRPSRSQGEQVLRTWQRRFELRYLLLDQLPACLAPLELDPALVLLLFDLLHEKAPDDGAPSLNYSHSGFALCFSTLAAARRELRAGYAEEFQSVTDSQAAKAVLWTLCLYKCWQTADFGALTQEQREACVRDFEHRALPRLKQHLEFIKSHRSTLRQLFADRHGKRTAPGTPSDSLRIHSSVFSDETDCPGRCLFQARHKFSGLCNLDNTDVIYFHALNSPVLRGEMESVTGTRLPDEFLCMTDFPPQADEPDTKAI
ncbi:MAG: hypothetical protein OXC07_09610 [Kistimonas sp.]|nr:hypothetical protein [Kistimonas sp.]